ncbi:nucleotidyltransferase domain-containing protein [Tengunoibacter tsumagoiensis]|uniref:Polymerase nucleotidyl transferase domain-containing protein n=1 Tax=Tengunoibacter tsumagoiensis TaxID=2014871 RepID=A0A401ZUX6_9CHLR|nr:nucleotidyltransferase domain-containing protein [Tengunoibacter tsumagoiensis]GCE10524.1 hypothetical protein KTT_03830 [Tengunoibacter tsumagoiensis]
MEAHHERTIQRLIELFQNDPRFPALIISGSIAHGNANPTSDVDVLLVASDEEYERRSAANDLIYFNTEICDYPGGYIDGKIVNLAFLQAAAAHGSEPTRYALIGAYPAYSHIPGLDELLKQITTYPEQERDRKMASFYSQIMVIHGYFIDQSVKYDNAYLLIHSISDLVLYAGRLLLAYNRRFFPCHKSLLDAISQVEQKPDDFIELANRALREPDAANAKALANCIMNYRDWGINYMEAINHFSRDSEWNWLDGRPPLADC